MIWRTAAPRPAVDGQAGHARVLLAALEQQLHRPIEIPEKAPGRGFLVQTAWRIAPPPRSSLPPRRRRKRALSRHHQLVVRATASASSLIADAAPTAASAFSTLRRFPLPRSATTTDASRSRRERPLGGRHADHAAGRGAPPPRSPRRKRLEQRLDRMGARSRRSGPPGGGCTAPRPRSRRRTRVRAPRRSRPSSAQGVGAVDERRPSAEVDRRRHTSASSIGITASP